LKRNGTRQHHWQIGNDSGYFIRAFGFKYQIVGTFMYANK